MRLRELRKLVEQLVAGGGAVVVESSAEVIVPGVHDGNPADWSLDPDYLPLGPIPLEANRPYLMGINFQVKGDEAAGDTYAYTPYLVTESEVGGAIAFGSSGGPVSAEWPTSAYQGAGNPGWGGGVQVAPMGPAELYLLFAAGDVTGVGPPSAPVTIRNRYLSVIQL